MIEIIRDSVGVYSATATPPDAPNDVTIPATSRVAVFDALVESGIPLHAVAMAFNRADGGTDEGWNDAMESLKTSYEAARNNPSSWRRSGEPPGSSEGSSTQA